MILRSRTGSEDLARLMLMNPNWPIHWDHSDVHDLNICVTSPDGNSKMLADVFSGMVAPSFLMD
jgi:hypothetical protein